MIFTHSLASDWSHGHVHFLRGIVRELLSRGHDVAVFEPRDAWSAENLRREHGPQALDAYAAAYPELPGVRRVYDPARMDPKTILRDADVVIVQERNDAALVAAVGKAAARDGRLQAYFHDAHHRSVTAPEELAALDLSGYDAVLAGGEVVRKRYLENGWAARAFTWHEAADTTVFRPAGSPNPRGDVVWIGNWGHEERARGFDEFLLGPCRDAAMQGTVHGVRYPESTQEAMRAVGLEYKGYLPNHLVPSVFAEHMLTVHLPRRADLATLRGIPAIRVFEALACGIPLVSAPWDDSEGLFRPGEDFLVARDGGEMTEWFEALRADDELRRKVRDSGLETVRSRHTCAHRVEEFMQIDKKIRGGQHPIRETGDHPPKDGVAGNGNGADSAEAADAGGPRVASSGSSLV